MSGSDNLTGDRIPEPSAIREMENKGNGKRKRRTTEEGRAISNGERVSQFYTN